jgi:hypothetical protein
MRQASYRFLLLPLLFVLACASVFAQANSEVTGIITDQTGAVVAGAKIVLTDQATSESKTTVSGSTGLYDIGGLNPSTYNLKATAKGFESFVQTGITVNISGTFRVDVKLTIGAEAQTIIITADALTVQSDSNEISNLITSEDISSLATENRNFASLAALGLGVTNQLPDGNAVAAVSSSWAISFNGLSQAHNVWLIDGGESYDRGSGGKSALQPSQDALAEFNVLSSNFPPDYGIGTGGTVSMALKSGGDKFHGTVYEENRNRDYNANTFFNKQSTPVAARPNTPYNIYGFNVGGPLMLNPSKFKSSKSKTFFFWNEEWRKTNGTGGFQGAPTIDPLDIPKSGTNLAYVTPKFAAAPINLIVPKGATDPQYVAKLAAAGLTPGQAFPNNVVPASLFDANAVLYLNSGILPAPNTNNDETNATIALTTNAREDLGRFDHSFNDKWSLMGHWIGESLLTAAPGPFLGWTSYSYNTVTSQLNSPSNSAVIKLSGTVTPKLLVEASLNYNGNMLAFQDSAIANKPAGWNITPVTSAFPLNQRTVMPGFTGFGAPYNTSEDTSTSPYSNAARDIEPKLDVSYTLAKHALKMGFSYNRYTKKQPLGGDSQGDYSMGANSKDGLIDLLLGLPNSYTQEQSTPELHWYNQTTSAYFNDNWHVNSRLSLQLGIRYDAMPHTVERQNQVANFDPSTYVAGQMPTWNAGDNTIATNGPGVQVLMGAPFYMNGVVIAGQNGTPRGLVKNDYNTWQPRVGFSDDLFGNGKTILRGGFGTFYERLAGNDVLNVGTAPFANSLSLSNTYFSTPGTSWQNGSVVTTATLPTFVNGLTSLATTYKAPMSAEFSLGVQRELSPSLIWQIQYVGNVDNHQSIQRSINTFGLNTPAQIVADAGDPNGVAPGETFTTTSLGGSSNLYRNFQGFGGIGQYQNTQTGNYNSFQTGLRIQNKWGLSGEVDYTYAHQIDTTANNQQDLAGTDNPWNLKYDKGSGVLDRRQQISANYVYKLPFFNKEKGLVRTIAGGWELAGTIVGNTGTPASGNGTGQGSEGYSLTYDTVGYGGGYTARPNQSGKVTYGRTQKQYFDITKFSAPTASWLGGPNLGFGNAGKDAIVLPGRINFTTSLYKNFAFTERIGFQLRFESFNTFNHTEFSGVNDSFGSANFGQVNGTWDPRALELGGRFTF